MTKADSKNRGVAGKALDDRWHETCLLGAPGSRREKNGLWLQRLNLLKTQLVVARDFASLSEDTKDLIQIEDKRIVVIDEENHDFFFLRVRSLGAEVSVCDESLRIQPAAQSLRRCQRRRAEERDLKSSREIE